MQQLNVTDVICPKEKAKVPNVVLAYWAGELGEFGKTWVQWDMDVNMLQKRGFFVQEQEGWTANKFELYIQSGTGEKRMHGIFFWGHGGSGGLLTDSNQKNNANYYTYYSGWNSVYKLAFGALFACHSQAGRGQFSNNAIFWGKTGVLVPHGFHLFGPTIDSLLSPGVQGTRK